ncbi:MAG: Lrp/AsnC family transcriptional regulator [Sneathiellales bacterium]|nr:Lrp/AsnC family transcriptional regulator [Sneathiellales bacterium]
MQLDRTDLKLLELLQKDARLSNKELAAAVELAPSSCHERLKNLRSKGILTKTGVEVDPSALGVGLEAVMMIEMSKHERMGVDTFLAEIVTIPEVRQVMLVTGQYDFFIHVMVRDMQHLKDLGLDKFSSYPGVTRIETSLVFDRRDNQNLPILLKEEEISGPYKP